MQLAWICYKYVYTRNGKGFRGTHIEEIAEILFYEPDSDDYDKVVPIVYAEIVKR